MTTDSDRTGAAPRARGKAETLLRVLSLLAALGCAALVVLYPRAIAHDAAGVPHGPLVGMLAGMSILWVYGFGFTPSHRILRWILSPLVGWVFLLGFGAVVFLHH
ncbi:cyd operon YbgE family protein [Sutterella sp.]|uniref:cyd operon YbgE family protein n=1 Tax=Sutterella sp. TaxID=1981025 RepID=UPI003FD8BEB5